MKSGHRFKYKLQNVKVYIFELRSCIFVSLEESHCPAVYLYVHSVQTVNLECFHVSVIRLLNMYCGVFCQPFVVHAKTHGQNVKTTSEEYV